MSTFDVSFVQRACRTACGAAAPSPGTASSGQRHAVAPQRYTERETLCVWVKSVVSELDEIFVYTYIL